MNRLIEFSLTLITRKIQCLKDDVAGRGTVCQIDGTGKQNTPLPTEQVTLVSPFNILFCEINVSIGLARAICGPGKFCIENIFLASNVLLNVCPGINHCELMGS